MVPGGRPLLAIDYTYNTRKVLYFIVKDNIGTTKAGLHHLSKYPEPFYNVDICPVARPLVMSKFFGSVNQFDSHKQ